VLISSTSTTISFSSPLGVLHGVADGLTDGELLKYKSDEESMSLSDPESYNLAVFSIILHLSN